jgi:hypothetical protein
MTLPQVYPTNQPWRFSSVNVCFEGTAWADVEAADVLAITIGTIAVTVTKPAGRPLLVGMQATRG